MKKSKLILLILLFTLVISLVACSTSEPITPAENEKVTVTFVLGDGVSNVSVEVGVGEKVTSVPNTDKDGYDFLGWYQTPDYTEDSKWNPDTDTVSADMTLYAKYEEAIDGLSIREIIALGNALQDGEKSAERYYVRATVVSVDDPTYGQMTISDGTDTISVYGTYSADGTLRYYELQDKPYAGDEVLLYALIQNFGGQAEIYSGWIIGINHSETNIDVGSYEVCTIEEARAAASGELLEVSGVVANITYAFGKVPNGFYLVDGTNSIYVFDSQAAQKVAVGNTVTVAGEKTYWILDTEQSNAAIFGYTGCCQMWNATIVSNDGEVSDFDTSWIPTSTVKEILDTPATENITTTIFKVNALVRKVIGSGFVNYYINDIDGTTGSYVYTQCSGSDFDWLDAFDGKICTVYLSAINAKSSASGCLWRFMPVKVIDENYVFDLDEAGKFAVVYYGVDQFLPTYTSDPALGLITSVSSELLGIDEATLSYSSDNEDTVYFDGNILHIGKPGTAVVTITGSCRNYDSYSQKITITVETANDYEYVTVSGAVSAEVDTLVTVKGVVGPSLVNQVGFYLVDDGALIAVKTTTDEMEKLHLGDEVIVQGTRTQYPADKVSDTFAGQACLLDSVILVNNYGQHDYSTASFDTTKTVKELYAFSVAEDHTTQGYIVTAKITANVSAYATTYYIEDEDGTQILLYSSGGGQYSWLSEYVNQTVRVEVALVSWNQKTYYRGCVLAVYLADGTKVVNELNFS